MKYKDWGLNIIDLSNDFIGSRLITIRVFVMEIIYLKIEYEKIIHIFY